jgi:4-amino-4-deoxy-L-arabinose transferase-like glycosyltransferase
MSRKKAKAKSERAKGGSSPTSRTSTETATTRDPERARAEPRAGANSPASASRNTGKLAKALARVRASVLSRLTKRELRWLVALTLIAFALRLLMSLREHDVLWDGYYYGLLGRNLIRGNFAEGLSTYWSPLYPFLVGISSLIFPDLMFAATFVSVVAGTLLVPLLYLMVREFYGHEAAGVGASLVIIYPPLVLYSAVFLTEATYTLLFAGAVFAGWLALTRWRAKYFLTWGVLFGACYLVKPEAFAYVGLALVVAIVAAIIRREVFKLRTILNLALLVVAFAALSAPYLFFLHAQTGHWMISEKTDIHLYGAVNIYLLTPDKEATLADRLWVVGQRDKETKPAESAPAQTPQVEQTPQAEQTPKLEQHPQAAHYLQSPPTPQTTPTPRSTPTPQVNPSPQAVQSLLEAQATQATPSPQATPTPQTQQTPESQYALPSGEWSLKSIVKGLITRLPWTLEALLQIVPTPLLLLALIGLLAPGWSKRRVAQEVYLLSFVLTTLAGYSLTTATTEGRLLTPLLPLFICWMARAVALTGNLLARFFEKQRDARARQKRRSEKHEARRRLIIRAVLTSLLCFTLVPWVVSTLSKEPGKGQGRADVGRWLKEHSVGSPIIMAAGPWAAFYAGGRHLFLPLDPYLTVIEYAQRKHVDYLVIEEDTTSPWFRPLTFKSGNQHTTAPALVPVYRYEKTPGHSIHVFTLADASPNADASPPPVTH